MGCFIGECSVAQENADAVHSAKCLAETEVHSLHVRASVVPKGDHRSIDRNTCVGQSDPEILSSKRLKPKSKHEPKLKTICISGPKQDFKKA